MENVCTKHCPLSQTPQQNRVQLVQRGCEKIECQERIILRLRQLHHVHLLKQQRRISRREN